MLTRKKFRSAFIFMIVFYKLHGDHGEPGFEERDNLLNTLKVASKSGFTSVGLQPNTFPVTEKSTEIEYLKAIAKNSNIDIYPIGALTKKSVGNELAELLEMKNSGAVAVGDYKKSIVYPTILKLALLYSKDFNLPIFSFPLNTDISNNGVMNESKTSTICGCLLYTSPSPRD